MTLRTFLAALKQRITGFDAGGKGETGSPGYVVLYDTSGEDWYLFVETDGTVKVHTTVPTQDSDGSEVGGQS